MRTTMLILALTAVVSVTADLTSGRQYLPPGRGHHHGGTPSGQYGAPAFPLNRFAAPSSQYGVPSFGANRFGAPLSQYGSPSLNRFGAPLGHNAAHLGQYGTPSSQYGAPGQYGVPSGQYGVPSGQYGVPSGQYGVPSGQLGAPFEQFGTTSGRYGSTLGQYGTSLNQHDAHLGQYGASSGQYNGVYSASRYGINGQDPLAEPANYAVSYKVQDGESGNDFGHEESRQGDDTRGSYHVLLPDGRTQIVDYVANEAGYTPTIRYEGGPNAGYPAATAVAGPY